MDRHGAGLDPPEKTATDNEADSQVSDAESSDKSLEVPARIEVLSSSPIGILVFRKRLSVGFELRVLRSFRAKSLRAMLQAMLLGFSPSNAAVPAEKSLGVFAQAATTSRFKAQRRRWRKLRAARETASAVHALSVQPSQHRPTGCWRKSLRTA